MCKEADLEFATSLPLLTLARRSEMLAAVAQICSRSSLSANLAASVSVIKRASALGARLVYLPEASDFIAEQSLVPKLLHALDESEYVQGILHAAKQHKVFVGVGVHELSPDGRGLNTHLLISDSGEILSTYRKTHLFDIPGLIMESKTTKPGTELVPPVQTPVGAIGLLTCYDVRFPEPSLRLRRQGAEILTYPSAFTLRTGAAHWELLLRARAVETQSYVLAPAQVGAHSETRNSYGRESTA